MLNKLASEIAKREGKRSQARIGDIREILKIIVDMEVDWRTSELVADCSPLHSIEDSAIPKVERVLKRKSKKKAGA